MFEKSREDLWDWLDLTCLYERLMIKLLVVTNLVN